MRTHGRSRARTSNASHTIVSAPWAGSLRLALNAAWKPGMLRIQAAGARWGCCSKAATVQLAWPTQVLGCGGVCHYHEPLMTVVTNLVRTPSVSAQPGCMAYTDTPAHAAAAQRTSCNTRPHCLQPLCSAPVRPACGCAGAAAAASTPHAPCCAHVAARCSVSASWRRLSRAYDATPSQGCSRSWPRSSSSSGAASGIMHAGIPADVRACVHACIMLAAAGLLLLLVCWCRCNAVAASPATRWQQPRIPVYRPPLLTKMTRDGAPATSAGSRRCVSAAVPSALVAKLASCPSGVRWRSFSCTRACTAAMASLEAAPKGHAACNPKGARSRRSPGRPRC